MNEKIYSKLIKILEEENQTVEKILELEIEKNQILISRDLKRLTDVTEEENSITDLLTRLEDERLSLLNSNGIPTRLDELLKDCPSRIRNQLKKLQNNLKNGLKQLKTYSSINNNILKESMDFFRTLVDLFTGKSDAESVYHSQGPVHEKESASLVLDRTI